MLRWKLHPGSSPGSEAHVSSGSPCLSWRPFRLAASFTLTAADNLAPSPNSDHSYQQLRNLTLGGEAFSVNNVKLKRDAGTFHFRSGTVCFVTPVKGKVTGAVFAGDGNFVLDVPDATERASLKLLTKEEKFSEDFSQAVFRFTDSTYDEIRKAVGTAGGACDAGLLKDIQNTTRHKLRQNMEARILADVLSPEPGGYFAAFIRGSRYSSKEKLEIDPNHGTSQLDFWTYEDNKSGQWLSLHLSDQKIPTGPLTKIEHQQLDVTFEKEWNHGGKGGGRDCVATQRPASRALGSVPFFACAKCSVDGQPASFVQEDKLDDSDFAVILPRAFSAGDKFTITTTYAGKDAVLNAGGGNYFPWPGKTGTPTTPTTHETTMRSTT